MGNDIFTDPVPAHTVSQPSQQSVQPSAVAPIVPEVPAAALVPQQEHEHAPLEGYMEKVKAIFGMPEADPRRKEQLLAFMGALEAGKAKGEVSIATVGEGEDRVVLFQNPAGLTVVEPAYLPLSEDDGDGRKIGMMRTIKDRYLAVNRKGFVGFDVTHDQGIAVDGSAEMFSDPTSPYKESPTEFNRQFGAWLNDLQINTQRSGLRGARRIVEVMQQNNYPQQPDQKQFLSVDDPTFLEAEQLWTVGSFMHPNGQWNGLITSSDILIDEPDRRTPNTQYWFDNGGGYRPFNTRKPETVEMVLQANMKKPNPSQPPAEAQTPSAPSASPVAASPVAV